MARLTLSASLLLAAPALAQSPPETPAQVVEALYRAHMPSITGTARGVLDDPALRRRFLTPALAAAILRSQERSRRAGEILEDTLDYDPITASQDPDVRNLRVAPGTVRGDRAEVRATFTQHGAPTTVDYVLALVDGRWLVYDIRGDGSSVRRVLRLRE